RSLTRSERIKSLNTMIITIDGPAGSGKSTIARALAQTLSYTYLDTGAMYRALTYRALQEGIALDDEAALSALAQQERISFIESGAQETRIVIGGLEVSKEIRTAEVDANVSEVSAHKKVREELVAQQQGIGRELDLVAEGRDMGSVVFPQAEVKVFLTASPQVRAHRRYLQNLERSKVTPDFDLQSEEEILRAIIKRDEYDASREISPLKAADDAHTIDTSTLNLQEVLDQIIKLVKGVQ
ncbi:MAG: (d)CMP kinase, partial [Coriobacteriia bacterium]|nr:(d)CMP kinase [Coriobacteriia bacterium]